MITYQDFLQVGNRPKDIADFVRKVINTHQSSAEYKTAKIADDYDRCRNTTIMQYQRMVTTVTGQSVPDKWSATHRSTSNFFNIFTTQLCQYLLGNGVTWQKDHEELGADFDLRLQQLGHSALVYGVSYGFYDLNRLVVFTPLNFAALLDEETGEIRVGVRFWQVDSQKPLRATLYEADGLTPFMWSKEKPTDDAWQHIQDNAYTQAKKPYTWVMVGDNKDIADGTVDIEAGEPVNGFPIIPLYANQHRQSELVGMREKIDAYDFIMNGFEDDLDNAQLYWIIQGAGGMTADDDLQQFLDRLRTVKAAAPASDQTVTPVTVEIPHAAREQLLDRLTKQLYRDAMIMNPEDIASGATTATQIRAAYERQNVKADQLEYCVLDFLYRLMEIAGIEDEPTFTRSVIVNVQEEVQTVVLAAQYLEHDYVTRKVLTLLGDGDKADDMIEARDADELNKIDTDEAGDDEDAETA